MAINTVEDLYREILGREPDAGGLAFWQQGFGDTVDPAEVASFKQAAQAELANRPAEEQVLLAPKVVDSASTGVTDADIKGWFNANPNADDALIAKTMQEAGITPERLASATGTNVNDVTTRFNAAIAAKTNTTSAAADTGATTATAPVSSTAKLFQDTFGRAPSQEEISRFGNTVDAGELDRFLGMARDEVVNTMPTTGAVGKMAKQILAQGTTGKWGGEGFGSAKKNAYDMAVMLAGQGFKDINDFGKVTQYAPAQEIGKFYNGQYVAKYDFGDGVTRNAVYQGTGQYDTEGNEIQKLVEVPKDAKLTTLYGRDNGNGELEQVDPSKVKVVDGKPVAAVGETFGNKKTGETINSFYDKAGGNVWGGTFAGKGSTSYGVQFTPDGKPVFYSQYGGSSNDFANLMQELGPLGNIALSAIGGPMAVAAMGVLSGQNPADIAKSAVLSYLGNQAGSFVSGMEGITDVLGDVGTNIASNATRQFVGSGGQGVNAGKLLLGSGLLSGGSGVDGPNSADFEEGYFNEGGEGYNILNSQGTDDFLQSIGINSIDELTDSGLSNADILSLVNADFGDMSGLEDFVSAGNAAYTGEEGFTEDVNGGGYSEDAEGNISIGSGGGGSGGGGGGGTKTTTDSNVATTTSNNVASTSSPVTKTTPATVTPTSVTPRKIVDVFPKTTTTTSTTKPKVSNAAKAIAGLVSGVKGAKAAVPTNPAVDAITNLAQQQSQQQNQQNALLNLMGGKDELANIKSYKELYGNDLFGDTYVPPSASESEAQGLEDEFFNGGHVDDLSIDALLHMLRN